MALYKEGYRHCHSPATLECFREAEDAARYRAIHAAAMFDDIKNTEDWMQTRRLGREDLLNKGKKERFRRGRFFTLIMLTQVFIEISIPWL